MPPMVRRSPNFHWQYRRVVDSGKKSRILKFDFFGIDDQRISSDDQCDTLLGDYYISYTQAMPHGFASSRLTDMPSLGKHFTR